MPTVSDIFIDYLYGFHTSGILQKDLEKAKACLKDYLGVTIGGANALFSKHPDICFLLEGASGVSSVIGTGKKSSLLNAALINGISSHYLELDDGFRFGMVHPGTVIFSALLPLVELKKISGLEFLKATVLAYEACLRLSKAMQPRLKEKGLHATGVVAGVGAALGLGFALGYSKDQLKSVLASAATSSSGILEVIRDESQLKPFNSGQAAMNGLAAGLSGKANMMGPNDVLGGSQGFFFVNSDASGVNTIMEESSEAFIHSIYVKPYAACRHAHAPVEAALYLKEEHGLDVEMIESVSVETYKFAVVLHDHQEVGSPASAKMSTPYAVAAALVFGKVGMEQFKEEAVKDERVQTLCKKVSVYESAELSAQVPAKRAAIVRIGLKGNLTVEHKIDFPKGEPENPMSNIEMDDKFSSLMDFAGVSNTAQEEILTIVDRLEDRMKELFDYL